MDRFGDVEWNTLVNRARATLRAQRTCCARGAQPAACRRCPLGETATGCRHRFRTTQGRLYELARQGPPSERLQLRRTVDELELRYRQLWEEEADHG